MPISIAPNEVDPLRTVMRDLQLAAARYYSGTATGEDLGALVRAFISHTQTINDWLTNVIGERDAYRQLFSQRYPRADFIDAMKYIRNVSEHVMHVVRPSSEGTLIGGALGMRFYARWDEVPLHVHTKLRPGTQALKPAYVAKLQGAEVMSTMMEVLRFYAEVAPDIVHRDKHGEWTGFPLMNQPGMSHALHPEEPAGAEAARAWMDARRPGGSSRVIVGQVTIEQVPYIFGHTFVGRYSFAPFAETIMQVNDDIVRGFAYLRGDALANVDLSDEFPDALQGVVLVSRGDVEEWTTPVTSLEEQDDWAEPNVDVDEWRKLVGLEVRSIVPEVMRHDVRRARRLNALVPSSLTLR